MLKIFNYFGVTSLQYIAIFVLGIVVNQLGNTTPGNCKDYPQAFPYINAAGKINRDEPVWVIQHNASVYADDGSQINTVKFGTKFFPKWQRNGRIQIKLGSSKDPMGWMDASALLCRSEPIKAHVDAHGKEYGLERKVFIKPDPTIHGQDMRTVTAYPHPSQNSCDGGCKELSRFDRYFIVDETMPGDKRQRGRYLLSMAYNLSQPPEEIPQPLVGWVDKASTIQWNTALGLRPKVDVQSIRAYPTLAQARQQKPTQGVEVLGGPRWYALPMRLALLERVEYQGQQFYKVAAPGVGGLTPFEGHESVINTLAARKHVDVFFTIDGTRSMRPFIRSASRTANAIINRLLKNPDYQETSFRFGFRIYRDQQDAGATLGESLPLGTNCEKLSRNAMQENADEFTSNLRRVKAHDCPRGQRCGTPDFLEQPLAGLKQTAKDIAGCPDNTKLIFLIGDAGDHDQNVTAVAQSFARYSAVIPFIIRTPRRTGLRNQANYNAAYVRFTNQGETLLDRLLPNKSKADHGRKIDHSAHSLTLDDESLIDNVVTQVGNFSNSSEVNELTVAIEGGQALEDYLRTRMVKGDLPVLYWEMLHRSSCQQLGERCTKRTDHRVIEAYIPVSNQLEEEVETSQKQLNQLIQLLDPDNYIPRDPQRARQEFVGKLAKQVQKYVGKPVIDNTESYQAYIEKLGFLPVRQHSPFLQYTPAEIKAMEGCIFNQLKSWVTGHYGILSSISLNPTKEPMFTEEPGGVCYTNNPKDEKLPRLIIESPPKTRELQPPDATSGTYQYSHRLHGTMIYWLPTRFLP